MSDDMEKRRADEARIAAEQDAALAAVKAACDAEREQERKRVGPAYA
jgi:hypothetical protein